VGSVDRQEAPGGAFLNSAFLLTGQGISAKYDKMHLVPFGEYVPLSGLIGFVRSWAAFISDFAPGEEATVFPLGRTPFGVVICYEVIFPELFRQFVAEGAVFMANITNDAWFGRTSAPYQHFAQASMRAIEEGRYLVRSANTGVTCFVNEFGRITQILQDDTGNTFTEGVLSGSVDVPVDKQFTFYSRYGEWFAELCAAVTAFAIIFIFVRRKVAR
jgi:apolipoprotein N-acyltransferase